ELGVAYRHYHAAVMYVVLTGPDIDDRHLAMHEACVAALDACGYTMGATWPPTWMEQPMIVAGSPVVIEESMTFFTHMICTDQTTGLQMALGEQAIITAGKPEIITHAPRQPVINNPA
ncbi:MAG: aminopeptidase P family protein, partial [Pseudomonadota bacterium]|nr:aminopeptidase P family protein [Pseudomonadota bacterium]